MSAITKKTILSLQLFVFLALGAGAPFFGIYFKKILLNPDGSPAAYWIGTLFFIQSITALVSPLIAGYIADKFKIQNRILAICSFFVFLSAIIIIIPGTGNFSFSAKLLLIGTGMIINGIFVRPVTPLIDTETLIFLENKHGKVDNYGRYRMFGTIGWVISACASGAVVHITGNILFAFIIYSMMFLILGSIALRGIKSKIKPVKIPWEYLKKDKDIKLYLVFYLIFSISFASTINFTGYFLDDMEVNYLIIGLIFGLASVLEIPVIFFGDKINKFLNFKTMIITGTVIQGLKYLFFYLIGESGSKLLYILAYSIHGLGFGIFFYGHIRFLDSIAHKDLRATYLNLYQFTAIIGSAIGLIISPVIIETWNSRILILVDSLIFFAAAIYLLAIPLKTAKNAKKS